MTLSPDEFSQHELPLVGGPLDGAKSRYCLGSRCAWLIDVAKGVERMSHYRLDDSGARSVLKYVRSWTSKAKRL